MLGFDLGASIAYKRLTALDGQVDPDCFELTPSIAREMGPVTARLSLIYSPDDLGATGRSAYADANVAWKLGKTSLSGGVGRRERRGSTDYTAFNVGIVHALHKYFTADLRYYDTARSELGDPFESRLVASVRARF